MTNLEFQLFNILLFKAFDDKIIFLGDYKTGIKYRPNSINSYDKDICISTESDVCYDKKELQIQKSKILITEAVEILNTILKTHIELIKKGVVIDSTIVSKILIKLGEWEEAE